VNHPSSAPSAHPGLSRQTISVVVALLLAGILRCVGPSPGTITSLRERTPAGSQRVRDAPADSPYLNARPGVAYVGDAACQQCHAQIVQTYRQHPMGRSLAPMGDSAEGARGATDTGLPIESKGVQYTIERRQGKLFHQATWHGTDGSVIAQIAAEVRYALGSGTRGIAFLIEREGTLFQSPIAWFAHQRRWDIAPGYQELATPPHFERPVRPGCLFCHANQFHPVPGTQSRYEAPIFHGHAIGCERCHGPGGLHVNQSGASTPTDFTIVNPAHLTPALRESVCQQCHLQGSYRFTRAGRGPLDFRPGLPIHRFWAIYMEKGNRETFEAVGHVEQMESSRCFRASQGRLGCISCHDPHSLPAASAKAAFYRDRCLACHEQRGCALPAAERRARGQGENCVACHMPRLAMTNIPHTAATDHRIPRGGMRGFAVGRSDTPPHENSSRRGGGPGLVAQGRRDLAGHQPEFPLWDYHWELMSETERRDSARDLGVALTLAARNTRSPGRARVAATAALTLLEAAVRAGPADLDARDSLAHALGFLDRPDDALRAFEEVLRREPGRELTLRSTGLLLAGLQRLQRARAVFEQAIEVNPWCSEYRALLARACYQAGDWSGAIAACQAGIRLNPELLAARSLLIESLLRSHQANEADAEFQTLLRLYPASREVWQEWYEGQKRAAAGALKSRS
jgi:Flp pilus assembly protein TadD